MAYWEALGLSGEPASGEVENLARWLQWAQTGILEGASRNEESIRYNLNQFWTEKKDYWDSADDSEREQLTRLDILAKGLLNALDTGKIVASSPNYWDYWKTWLFGGTPARPESQAAAAEAAQAAKDASTVARQAGQPELAAYFVQQAQQVPEIVKAGNAMWKQDGSLNFLGIPWWIWLIGGGLLLWQIYGPKGQK